MLNVDAGFACSFRNRWAALTPNQGELQIDLKGNLAAMLGAAQKAKRSPETGDLSLQVVMVAGGGFEPPTFGL